MPSDGSKPEFYINGKAQLRTAKTPIDYPNACRQVLHLHTKPTDPVAKMNPPVDLRERLASIEAADFANKFMKMTPEDRMKSKSLPTDVMKQIRQFDTIVICVGCKNIGTIQATMICGKCKIAAYCSKSCQKGNWAIHKRVCREPTTPLTFKLLQTFLSDPFAFSFLPQAFVAVVGGEKRFTFDDIYLVRCDLSIEPLFQTVVHLGFGDTTIADYPNGADGVIQVKRMYALDPSIVMDSARDKIWKDAKEKAFLPWRNFNVSTNGYGPVLAVGIIDFHIDGIDQVVTMPIPIQRLGLEMASLCRHGFDEIAFAPYSTPGTASLVERFYYYAINSHIQQDVTNMLRLKVRLPQKALKKYEGIDLHYYAQYEVPVYPPPAKLNKFLEALYPDSVTDDLD